MVESRNNSSTLLLLSGGVDSTALIPYFLERNSNVRCIHFEYGQKNKEGERRAVQNISNYYNVQTEYISLGFPLTNLGGEYISRNALFILMAANLYPKEISTIALGIHDGTPYYDCSQKFLRDCQTLIDGYFNGTLTIDAPFLLHNKEQVFHYCIDNKIPLNLTYSCERRSEIPCGTCPSCKDRSVLNELYSL